MIAISDIHLGPGNGRDDFRDDSGFKDLRFGAALAYWKKRGERIILVGDTFECWQANMAEIEAAHPLAMVAIRDCVDVIVRGNHDWRLEEACGKQLVDEWIEGACDISMGTSWTPSTAGGWHLSARRLPGLLAGPN